VYRPKRQLLLDAPRMPPSSFTSPDSLAFCSTSPSSHPVRRGGSRTRPAARLITPPPHHTTIGSSAPSHHHWQQRPIIPPLAAAPHQVVWCDQHRGRPAGLRYHSLLRTWPSVTNQISGQSVANQWSISGQSAANQRPISGQSAANQWPISGQSVVNQWSISGQSVVNQWPISGQSVVNQWPIRTSRGCCRRAQGDVVPHSQRAVRG
jgi:hypothetical protein